MEPKLIRNRIRCKTCDDIIESKYGHDFKYCKCGKVFVDGGLEYCRYGYPGGDVDDWIEMMAEYQPLPEPAVSHYGLLLDKSEESGIIGGKVEQ